MPRPSVALVVIFDLESLTLEGKPSSCYLIRHEPMVEEYTQVKIILFLLGCEGKIKILRGYCVGPRLELLCWA